MQLSMEEYARKRINNAPSVQIENSVTLVTVRHHSASLVMSNSYPRDRIFNQHLTTIKDSYIPYRYRLVESVIRPKNRCVSTNMPKKLGSVGRKLFLFLSAFYMMISGQTCFWGLNVYKIVIKHTNN